MDKTVKIKIVTFCPEISKESQNNNTKLIRRKTKNGTNQNSNSISSSQLPCQITAVYTDDYDILNLHSIIVAKFKWLKDSELVQLKEKLNQESEAIKQPQTLLDRKRSLNIINKTEERIKEIENNTQYATYINE